MRGEKAAYLPCLMKPYGYTFSICDPQPNANASNMSKGLRTERSKRVNAMKDEYDFSNAERGKFYRPNLRLIPPVRLEPQVLDFLAKRAEAKGTSLNALLNALLKKDIELIEAA